MRKLSEPINGTELYLAAIHEVLCDIRTALVGGDQDGDPQFVADLDPRIAATTPGPHVDERFTPSVPGAIPTKRTRTRNR